jgi:hypothetical protein
VASKRFKRPILTREGFLEHADKFRSPHLWRKDGDGWKLRHAVWMNEP